MSELNNFSDKELEDELNKREKESTINFVRFLSENLTGKKVNGKVIKSIKLKNEHHKEPDTPQNDWWGNEYDVEFIQITSANGDIIEIYNLEDLLKLKIKK